MAIKVVNQDESNGNSVIDPQGDVTIQAVGRLHAGGKTLGEFEEIFRQKLAEFLTSPKFTLGVMTPTIEESGTVEVTVTGAVGTPGVKRLTGKRTLLDLVADCGAQRPEASEIAQLTRKIEKGMIPLPGAKLDPSGLFSVANVNLRTLSTPAGQRRNIELEHGDVLTVPQADIVYVMGAVHKPGGFVFQEKGKSSLLKLLTLAEGLDKLASPSKAYVIRLNPGYERQQAQVDLKKVLNGEAPDVLLEPNDVLVVPTSTAKTILSSYPQTLTQIVTSLALYAVR